MALSFLYGAPKGSFYRDYVTGVPSQCCSSPLVNIMLALGGHSSSWEGSGEDPNDSATTGDHFMKEAQRLILGNDGPVTGKLCTAQALALLSVREAGCTREGTGWVYSGMSFRMAFNLGPTPMLLVAVLAALLMKRWMRVASLSGAVISLISLLSLAFSKVIMSLANTDCGLITLVVDRNYRRPIPICRNLTFDQARSQQRGPRIQTLGYPMSMRNHHGSSGCLRDL